MFAKLLKHEWKANSRLLGILSLCALGVGVLGGGAIQVVTYFTSKVVSDGAAALIVTGFMFLIFGLFMALVLYASGTSFYLLFRFYKTRFTDEGYLTFTLPVSNRSIFLSSYVSIFLWTIISVITVFVSIAIAVGIGSIGHVESAEMWEVIGMMREELAYMGMDGYMALQTAGAFLAVASSLMITMASITVGAVIAKKHKILAAIGIYYAQSVVLSVVSSVIQVVATLAMVGSYGDLNQFMWISSLTYLIQAAWAVGAYFLSMHLINKKLNLP